MPLTENEPEIDLRKLLGINEEGDTGLRRLRQGTTGYLFDLSIRSRCLVLTFNLIDSYKPGLPGLWDIPKDYGIRMTWSNHSQLLGLSTGPGMDFNPGLRPYVPWSVPWCQGSFKTKNMPYNSQQSFVHTICVASE
jgi:hypothetical protein